MIYASFHDAITEVRDELRTRSDIVHTEKWQGVDIKSKPEMATHELRHVHINVALKGEESLDFYRQQIEPNLPWADDQFAERVCGQPINPGVQWRYWPYAHSAGTFIENSKFNHNYMERYWPKNAGWIGMPTATAAEYYLAYKIMPKFEQGHMRGIYHKYGDLSDVVNQLVREPHTRQAILPVFFPEDTGAVHGGRVPCSLSYQFLMRNAKMDVVYVIRSCDFVRHFRDDIYLTVRLLLWILDECRKKDKRWGMVHPGRFIMSIASLHMFRNDFVNLFGAQS